MNDLKDKGYRIEAVPPVGSASWTVRMRGASGYFFEVAQVHGVPLGEAGAREVAAGLESVVRDAARACVEGGSTVVEHRVEYADVQRFGVDVAKDLAAHLDAQATDGWVFVGTYDNCAVFRRERFALAGEEKGTDGTG